MPTLKPEVFVSLEGVMQSALTREWAVMLSPVVSELYDLISQKRWSAAHMLIDTVHLNDAISNTREQLEELAISALLFGASNASGNLATTSYSTGDQAIPDALRQALDQLDLSLKYNTAEEIRWSLHAVVAEAEQAEKVSQIGKEDIGQADLLTAGLLTPDQGLGSREQTLYVHRPLLNSAELIAWAKEQGFASTLEQDDFHVTVCFSRALLDWSTINPDGTMYSTQGDARALKQFGKAIVLTFESDALQDRHAEFMAAGASFDHESYTPHVTITYASGDLDLSQMQPYTGPLDFGSEVWSPLKEDWADGITETKLQKAELTLAQRLNAAVLEGKALVDINANLTTSRLIQLGFLSEAATKNITTYQVSEVLDERTCPVCQVMHGKTFSVVQEYSKILTVLGTTDPAEIRNLAPWPRQSKQNVASLASMTQDELQNSGLGSPPYHPLCRGFLVQVGTVTELTPMKGPTPPQVDMSWIADLKNSKDLSTETRALMSNLNMTRDDFLKNLIGDEGYETIDLAVTGLGNLRVEAYDGKRVSSIVRVLNFKAGGASHDIFEINEGAQGKGIAKTILASAVKTYKALNLNAIGLLANIDIGGYAWAKYGFLPDASAWQSLRPTIQKNLVKLKLPESEHEAYLSIAKSNDPKALWLLADSPIGKDLLRRTSWVGELYFDDPDAMMRFNNYVGR